jgi:hypothetical protein
MFTPMFHVKRRSVSQVDYPQLVCECPAIIDFLSVQLRIINSRCAEDCTSSGKSYIGVALGQPD